MPDDRPVAGCCANRRLRRTLRGVARTVTVTSRASSRGLIPSISVRGPESHVRSRPSPGIAAALSFLLPGLGQIAVGALRRGALLLVPLVAILVLGVLVSGGGLQEVIDLALDSRVLTAFLIVNLLLAAWHVFAIIDAERTAIAMEPAPRRSHRGATALVVGLVVVTIGMHGALEVVAFDTSQTLDKVFVSSSDDDQGLEIPDTELRTRRPHPGADRNTDPGRDPVPGPDRDARPDPVTDARSQMGQGRPAEPPADRQ